MAVPPSGSSAAATSDDVLAAKFAAAERPLTPETSDQLARVNLRIAEKTAEHENKARGVITWVVMIVYCAGLLLVGILLMRLAFGSSSTAEDAKNALEQGLELMKVAILPVVTLVIGYYIGQRRSGN